MYKLPLLLKITLTEQNTEKWQQTSYAMLLNFNNNTLKPIVRLLFSPTDEYEWRRLMPVSQDGGGFDELPIDCSNSVNHLRPIFTDWQSLLEKCFPGEKERSMLALITFADFEARLWIPLFDESVVKEELSTNWTPCIRLESPYRPMIRKLRIKPQQQQQQQQQQQPQEMGSTTTSTGAVKRKKQSTEYHVWLETNPMPLCFTGEVLHNWTQKEEFSPLFTATLSEKQVKSCLNGPQLLQKIK